MWADEASIDLTATPAQVWPFFANVSEWASWNAGIERIELRGAFVDGAEFTMKPPGMEPLVSRLTDVRPGESFTDVTLFEGTTVKVVHALVALTEGRTRVVYRAEVTGPAASEIGPMVTADFPEVLSALKRLVEQRSAATAADP